MSRRGILIRHWPEYVVRVSEIRDPAAAMVWTIASAMHVQAKDRDVAFLGALLGMSTRKVRSCLSRLEACGLVSVDGERFTVKRTAVVCDRMSGWHWRQRRERVLKRDGHVCRYCRGPATTVDHVVALTRGGSNEEANLVAACASCNSRKNDREVSP